MFAKSSNLSSNAAVFMPQGTTTGYMQQQYYTNNCDMNSYGMGSYSYGYDNSYSQSWTSQNWTGASGHGVYAKKTDVLNLDDFSDLSDSDTESVTSTPLMKTSTVKKEVAAPEALVMEIEPNEPAEEPSPCATDSKSPVTLKDLEAETQSAFGTRTLSSLSSASSEPEGEMSVTLGGPCYDLAFLLKCRMPTEAPAMWYRTMEVPEKTEKPKTPELKPSPSKEIRRKPKAKLEVSENSWGAQQRRLKSEAKDSKEQVSRTIKSILNKLTLEKFASLSQQLLECGISSSEHLVVLIHEVFEKATTQHHFIDMYADLCVLLHEHFTANPLDKQLTFKRLLLDECQSSFERLLAPPEALDQLSPEERRSAEVSYKTHMLGNIKLVGGLLARGMLAAKVGIAILEELLSNPTPEALESVAALLTAMGSSADRPEWPQKKALNVIFDQLAAIVKNKSCQTRERCLLKDLLDLRRNGWVDKRPKKLERAMTLAQVAEGGHGEATPKVVRRVATVATFDQDKFRQALRQALQSEDADSAMERLRAAGAPPASKQAMELAEFLSQVVQEVASKRAAGFKLFLKVAGEWQSEALAQGVKIFVTEMAADLALDVPNLSQILEEFYNILVAARISSAAEQAVKGFQAN